MNYYNEFNPDAAKWLRYLITEKLIPNGYVDDRSIRDVRSSDLLGYTQCHFFAGISGWSRALELAGWPADKPVWTGSCPCQPYSAAGKGKGAADERDLWPVWFRLISECGPRRIFAEQVSSAIGHGWLDRAATDLEDEGYAVGAAVLPASGYGAPHKRDRLWFVADSNTSEWRSASTDRNDSERANPGRQESSSHARERSGYGAMADADIINGGTRHAGRPSDRDARISDETRGHSAMADANGEPQREPQHAICTVARGEQGPNSGGRAPDDQLGDTNGYGFETRHHAVASSGQRYPALADGGQRGAFGNADNEGLARRPDGRGDQSTQQQPAIERTSRNFWADAEWLACADGKTRRVKSGVRLLVNGIPPRVVAPYLAGFGNAIVPQVAAAFIRASQ